MSDISKKRKFILGLIMLTVALSMLLFYFVYRLNNKYTAAENKAIQGILYVDQEHLEEKGVYYLSREWEYYPDVLLTPEEIQENKGDYYCRYLSIGEFGGMDLGDRTASPYGSATYRLVLMLPEQEENYALYLPEIFSSYQLYVNGKLMGKTGDPDPEGYQETVQNKAIYFTASGKTDLVIGVTDKSSVSSGIQYVPVFGKAMQVNQQRGIQLFLGVMSFTLSMFVLLLSVYMAIRSKTRTAAYFSFLSICILGYTSYSVFHYYLALKVQPWYGLETLFYYLMFSALILLLDEVTGQYSRLTVIMASSAGIWSFAAFAGELLANKMETAGQLYCLSAVSDAVTWIVAAYLIVKSFAAAGTKPGNLLLVSSLCYGCSLAADRIWSLYEPIVGGYFAEGAGAFLAVSIGIVIWKEIAEALSFRLMYEERSREMEQRLIMQTEYHQELSGKIDEMNKFRHDIRQHIRTMQNLLDRGKLSELQKYLEEFQGETIQYDERICYCRNMAVDAIFHYYAGEMKKGDIAFEYEISVPSDTGISDLDLCKLFGNLLENAVEAAEKISAAEKRFVRVTCRIRQKKILIEVINSCERDRENSTFPLKSTKHREMGMGTGSVAEIAEKYGGYADFQSNQGVFTTNVFLAMSEK